MKIAIWILSVVVVALGLLAIWQRITINKFNNPQGAAEGDAPVRFGDMVSAFQKEAKEITITTKL